jgi:hypothetical protein
MHLLKIESPVSVETPMVKAEKVRVKKRDDGASPWHHSPDRFSPEGVTHATA